LMMMMMMFIIIFGPDDVTVAYTIKTLT
jgi:hypothetical protein